LPRPVPRVGCTSRFFAVEPAIVEQEHQRDEIPVTAPLLRDSRLVCAYRRYLTTADAARFALEVSSSYASSTLLKMLTSGSIEHRRAASLVLGMLGEHEAIEPLGRCLSDKDRGVRLAADDSFRGLLIRDAAPIHQHQLLQIMHLNDGGEFAAALPGALILTDRAPRFAEAHHQLAICWLGLGDFIAAENAYRTCLWWCRFHYPSWIGFAHCRLRSSDPSTNDVIIGLKALQRAIEICPDLESARLEARQIERSLYSEESDELVDLDPEFWDLPETEGEGF
jgi:hypothetical protein